MKVTSHKLLGLVAIAAGLFFLTGCKEIPRHASGSQINHGALGINILGYELAYLELQSDSGEVVTTTEPVLLLRFTATNLTSNSITYDTRESATSTSQGQTPVLFVDPGAEAKPTVSISQIDFNEFRYLGDPVRRSMSLEASATVEDIMIFRAPPEGTTSLLMSFPSIMFGSGIETPLHITIPYEPDDPEEPEIGYLGAPGEGDGFEFTLNRFVVDYHTNTAREAFTDPPALALYYRIRNTSDVTLTYDPPHHSQSSATAMSLTDGTQFYDRLIVPAQWGIEDQLVDDVHVAPGETVNDVAFFERPGDSGQLLLLFPGRNVGRNGQVRISFNYQFREPEIPVELLEGSGEGSGEAPPGDE